MSEQDRRRWNERYLAGRYDLRPAASLVGLAPRLRPRRGARALDLACGAGRNALFLAELGYHVDAWDVADVALAVLRAELDRRAAAGQPLAVTPLQVDLDTAELPAATYDLVLDYYFLDRRLFPAMAATLRPGGLLLCETYVDSARGREHIANPAHLLQRGELPRAFASLDIIEYIEDEAAGTARILARRR